MLIGIVGALPEEINLILADMRISSRRRIGNADFYKGVLWGKNVVLTRSGWGKVSAAATATTLILRYKVRKVIMVGLAGAVRTDLRIGDIVVARNLIQYDIDASPIFPRYTVPDLGISYFETDASLRKAAVAAARKFLSADAPISLIRRVDKHIAGKHPFVCEGLIATGDKFISDSRRLSPLRRSLKGICCVEMEGAAIAQVCTMFRVPFVVMRVMSDKAGRAAKKEFLSSVANIAAVFSRGIIRRLLQKI